MATRCLLLGWKEGGGGGALCSNFQKSTRITGTQRESWERIRNIPRVAHHVLTQGFLGICDGFVQKAQASDTWKHLNDRMVVSGADTPEHQYFYAPLVVLHRTSLALPLTDEPGIGVPSGVTHQQYLVSWWHCTSAKAPSVVHSGM